VKIEDVIKGLKPLGREERIYNYIMQHPDEVYTYYDDDLKVAFPDIKNEDSLNWYLYDLAKNKKIEKIKIRRNAYFGSKEAIEELLRRLPKDQKPKT
jgi:hypothetical protein